MFIEKNFHCIVDEDVVKSLIENTDRVLKYSVASDRRIYPYKVTLQDIYSLGPSSARVLVNFVFVHHFIISQLLLLVLSFHLFHNLTAKTFVQYKILLLSTSDYNFGKILRTVSFFFLIFWDNASDDIKFLL